MAQPLKNNWITTQQAAEIIGCTADHVTLLVRQQKFSHERLGKRLLLLDRKDVERFAETPQKTGRPRKKQK